jgi:hypothetical protein
MGLDINGVKFLLQAKRDGVDFGRTAMLGRQEILIASAKEWREALDYSKMKLDPVWESRFQASHAEPFMEFLGANEIHSFDYSLFEGATHQQDLNLPIPNQLRQQYSVVLDGGTLEHVFNFPIALCNAMQMIAVGGHYLGISPGNNFLGHGFYQFSPELFFNVFCSRHGFSLQRMFVCEVRNRATWYSVVDPRKIGKRVTLVNLWPTYVMIIAKKVAEVSLSQESLLQSDYVAQWESTANTQELSPLIQSTWTSRLIAWSPQRLRVLFKLLKTLIRPFDPQAFHPFHPN